MLECTEVETAIFVLLASHYVFNLSYHTKATYCFIFEREGGTDSIWKWKIQKSKRKVSHPYKWNIKNL